VRNQHLMRSTLPTSTGFIPQPTSTSTSSFHSHSHSHSPSTQTPPFAAAYTFKGTTDNTPEMCLPAALAYRANLGGEAAILSYCHNLARSAGARVAEVLGTRVLENEEGTLGNCCFSNVALPLDNAALLDLMRKRAGGKEGGEADADAETKTTEAEAKAKAKLGTTILNWLTLQLVHRHDTFMAIIFYADEWWVRLSAQVYLDMDDFEWGANVLQALCEEVRAGKWLG